MTFSKRLAAAAATLCMGALAPAHADVPACSFSNLSGVTVTDCAGFYEGNLIGENADHEARVATILLEAFGLSGDGTLIEKLEIVSGRTIDFAMPLAGDVVVGLHFGNGAFAPHERGAGGGTAFYRFDAGASLDAFSTTLEGLSNAAVYAVAAPVPEPETYALMLAGLAAVGFIARRRKPWPEAKTYRLLARTTAGCA